MGHADEVPGGDDLLRRSMRACGVEVSARAGVTESPQFHRRFRGGAIDFIVAHFGCPQAQAQRRHDRVRQLLPAAGHLSLSSSMEEIDSTVRQGGVHRDQVDWLRSVGGGD